MKNLPYAYAIGSLMFAQFCIRPDIAYVASILRRFLSNLGLGHRKAAKNCIGYVNYPIMYFC